MAIDFELMSPEKRAWLEAHGYHNPIPGVITHAKPVEPKRKQQGRGENQLEKDFEFHILGKPEFRIIRPLQPFKLAGNTTYLPDWEVFDLLERLWWLIELKGPYEYDDGSRIKIKIAARLYPQYRWLWVTSKNGVFRAKEVTAAKGIGRKFIQLPWLV